MNEPTIVVSAAQVLGLYNQQHKEESERKERVVDSVKEWYAEEMTKRVGWASATFHGNQCLLEANVQLAD